MRLLLWFSDPLLAPRVKSTTNFMGVLFGHSIYLFIFLAYPNFVAPYKFTFLLFVWRHFSCIERVIADWKLSVLIDHKLYLN